LGSWLEYVALARQLDDAWRAVDATTTAAVHRRDEVSAAIDQLDRRLAAQGQRLAQLGRATGQHFPSRPVVPAGGTDPEQALRRVSREIEAADVAASEAEQLSRQAPLLPAWPPLARNLAVYCAVALLAVVVQAGVLLVADLRHLDEWTVFAWVLGGVPALAFFTGYLILTGWGRPRAVTEAPTRSPRLGFAICFLAAPAIYSGYKLVVALF
jgi:hypothetical protein